MKIAYLFLNGELRGSKKFYLDFIEKIWEIFTVLMVELISVMN